MDLTSSNLTASVSLTAYPEVIVTTSNENKACAFFWFLL